MPTVPTYLLVQCLAQAVSKVPTVDTEYLQWTSAPPKAQHSSNVAALCCTATLPRETQLDRDNATGMLELLLLLLLFSASSFCIISIAITG